MSFALFLVDERSKVRELSVFTAAERGRGFEVSGPGSSGLAIFERAGVVALVEALKSAQRSRVDEERMHVASAFPDMEMTVGQRFDRRVVIAGLVEEFDESSDAVVVLEDRVAILQERCQSFLSGDAIFSGKLVVFVNKARVGRVALERLTIIV